MRLSKLLKWLSPGIQLKRWMLLTFFGLGLCWISAMCFYKYQYNQFGIIFLLTGTVTAIIGARKFINSLLRFINPRVETDVVTKALDTHHLKKGLKIVALGGGTGLSTLLMGLKEYTSNITAIVTVTDEGGSSGKLRKDFSLLPPGDIRQCLAALSSAPPLMADLFQYRFKGNSTLSPHSFGNLFILAMTKITGDFELALKESSKILAIHGQVLPSTPHDVRIVAQTHDGETIEGELEVAKNGHRIKKLSLSPEHVPPSSESIKAIEEADAIILGPGSLYTSIIPNLLIEDIKNAILKSKAHKIFISNVMTQFGETEGFTLYDHLDKIIAHSSRNIFDSVIANTNTDCIPAELLEKYRKENAEPVKADKNRIENMGYRFIGRDIISVAHFVRHDPQKLAAAIVEAVQEKQRNK